jgi:hypothetical protein
VTTRVGSPIVLTTTAEDDMVEDDATRFFTIRVDETSTRMRVFKAAIAAGGRV